MSPYPKMSDDSLMATPHTEMEKMGAIIAEMTLTIRNLSSQATAHGLMDPHVNHVLLDAIDGNLITKPMEETLGKLKQVNDGSIPEWSFLNLG